MRTERRFYVYVHRRETDGTIFYVGKGIKSRAALKSRRSTAWKKIAHEHGVKHEIVYGPMAEACAFSCEKAIIASIGRDRLCNLTSGGGSGTTGYKFKKETVRLKAEKCMKPVINSDGNVFPSLFAAKEWLRKNGHSKATESHISSCCTGKRHVSYGFSWSFDTSKVPPLIDCSAKVNENRLSPVVASNGMVFKSVSDAAEWVRSELFVKCGTSDISRCCNGKRKTCGGLEWRYFND